MAPCLLPGLAHLIVLSTIGSLCLCIPPSQITGMLACIIISCPDARDVSSKELYVGAKTYCGELHNT